MEKIIKAGFLLLAVCVCVATLLPSVFSACNLKGDKKDVIIPDNNDDVIDDDDDNDNDDDDNDDNNDIIDDDDDDDDNNDNDDVIDDDDNNDNDDVVDDDNDDVIDDDDNDDVVDDDNDDVVDDDDDDNDDVIDDDDDNNDDYEPSETCLKAIELLESGADFTGKPININKELDDALFCPKFFGYGACGNPDCVDEFLAERDRTGIDRYFGAFSFSCLSVPRIIRMNDPDAVISLVVNLYKSDLQEYVEYPYVGIETYSGDNYTELTITSLTGLNYTYEPNNERGTVLIELSFFQKCGVYKGDISVGEYSIGAGNGHAAFYSSLMVVEEKCPIEIPEAPRCPERTGDWYEYPARNHPYTAYSANKHCLQYAGAWSDGEEFPPEYVECMENILADWCPGGHYEEYLCVY